MQKFVCKNLIYLPKLRTAIILQYFIHMYILVLVHAGKALNYYKIILETFAYVRAQQRFAAAQRSMWQHFQMDGGCIKVGWIRHC